MNGSDGCVFTYGYGRLGRSIDIFCVTIFSKVRAKSNKCMLMIMIIKIMRGTMIIIDDSDGDDNNDNEEEEEEDDDYDDDDKNNNKTNNDKTNNNKTNNN